MRIGIIGAGVMGEVITSSLLAKRVVEPHALLLSDISRGALHALESRHGCQVTMANEEVVERSDVVILSVKPQNAAELIASLAGRFQPEQMALSIMAGVSLDTLRRGLRHDRVVRAMPNIPARIGEGMTVWIGTPEIPKAHRMVARMIFQAFGGELEVHDEELIDAATAVSGSGPAYVFLVAEMLMDAATALGFAPAQAQRLVLQTFQGAVNLWARSGERPEQLRLDVTSKGGTTQAAVGHFEEAGTRAVFTGAVRAAFTRAGELRRMVAGPAPAPAAPADPVADDDPTRR